MLREALWEAITEKGYEGLTVSEVCERAMINRATFYRHYEDINDLLLRGMDELFDEIYALGDRPYTAEELSRFTVVGPSRNIRLLFRLFSERADFFRFMLSDRGIPSFVTRMRSYLVDTIIDRINTAVSPDSRPLIPISIVAHGWAGQILGILIWWLEDGQDISVEDMAVFLTTTGFHSIYENLDFERPKFSTEMEQMLLEANERFEKSSDRTK